MKSIAKGGRLFGHGIVAIFLLGCPQRTAIWLEPGSRLSALTFLVSTRKGLPDPVDIGVLRVDRCGANERSKPLWLITGTGGTATIHRIRYGVLPQDFASGGNPQVLVPGCYQVTISGTGWMEFDVHPDSTVTERKS